MKKHHPKHHPLIVALLVLLAVAAVGALLFWQIVKGQGITPGRTGKPACNGVAVTAALEEQEEQTGAFHSIQLKTYGANVRLVPGQRFAIYHKYNTDVFDFQWQVEDGTLHVWEELTEKYSNKKGTIRMTGAWNLPQDIIEIHCPAEYLLRQIELENTVGDVEMQGCQASGLTVVLEDGDLTMQQCAAGQFTLDSEFGDAILVWNGRMAQKAAITMSSGDFHATGLQARDLAIESSYGDVWLQEGRVQTADIAMNSGSLTLQEMELTLDGQIRNDYGEVRFWGGSARGLSIGASSGDVMLLGQWKGALQVINEHGDVKIGALGQASDYGYTLTADEGSIQVGDQYFDPGEEGGTTARQRGGRSRIEAYSQNGDIRLAFLEAAALEEATASAAGSQGNARGL